MSNKLNLYRQGDVLFKAVASLPQGSRKLRVNGIVAYGEATGHSHAVADLAAAELYEINGSLYLSVTTDGGVSIVHQEHGPVTLPKGDYGITIQREYSPDEIRDVVD